MINVYVVPEMAFKENEDLKDSLVISIVSPGREHPKIIGSNIHRFQFHDISQEYFLENQNKIIRPMEEEIAEQIADIAMKNVHCKEWIIHCEAGISRSPAVAIALSKYIKLNPNRRILKKVFPLYNKYVCQLIEDAMDVEIDKLERELSIKPGCRGEE